MKRFVRIICLALLAGLVLSSSAMAQNWRKGFDVCQNKATVRIGESGGQVNIRSGPGLSYETIGTLKSGELPYLDESRQDDRGVTWYKVRCDGKDGWVSEKYTELVYSDSDTGDGSGASIMDGLSYVVLDDGVVSAYVRRGPGLEYIRIGEMMSGSLEYLNETQTDGRGVVWYKVRFKGNESWISSTLTRLVGSWETESLYYGGKKTGVLLYNLAENDEERSDGQFSYKIAYFDDAGGVHTPFELETFYFSMIWGGSGGSMAELWKISNSLYFVETRRAFEGVGEKYMLFELKGNSLRLLMGVEDKSDSYTSRLVECGTGREIYSRDYWDSDNRGDALNRYFSQYGLSFVWKDNYMCVKDSYANDDLRYVGTYGVDLPDSKKVDRIENYEKARSIME